MKINIDYKTLSTEEKGVKELVRTFKKKGAEIVAIDVPDKVKKTSGVAYKELFLTFADSQQVALRISEKNAIFQVMINNRLTPIKNQDDHDKAVIEMIDLMDAGRKAFTKKLEARAMEVPLEEKTSTSAMRVELQAKRDGLKESIASLESELVELHAAHETSAAQDELKQTKDDIPIATIPEVNQTATEQPTVQPEPIVLTGEEPEYVDDESDEPEQPSNDTSSLVTEFADKVSKTSVQRSKIINKLNAISNKNTDLTNAQWLQKAVDAGKDVLRGMVDQYKVYKIEYEFAQFLKGDLPDLKPSVSDKVKKVTVGAEKNTPTEQPAAVPTPTEQPAAVQPARFSPEIEAILSKKSEQAAPPRAEAIQWLNSVIAGTQSDAIGSVEFSDKFIAILEEYEPLHDDMYPLLEQVSAMEDEVVESILMDSI